MPSNTNKKVKPPSQLNDVFYKKLIEVSKKINIKPEDLLLIMHIESGLNPQAKNPSGSASGLTQIMPSILPLVGFSGTPQDFSKLPAEKQLDYIEKYFILNLKGKGITEPAQIYLSNFLPATLNWQGVKNKNPDTILAEQGNMRTYAQSNFKNKYALTFDKVYQANKGLDLDKDGNISYGDIQKLVEIKRKDPVYQAAVARMKEVANMPEDTKEDEGDSDSFTSYISTMIDELKKLFSSASSNDTFIIKQSLFQHLPTQNILIKINSEKIENNLELARILSEACEEVLLSNCEIYTNKKEAEILCKIPGNLKSCYAAVNELSGIITNKFNKIINPNKIKIEIFANKKPCYHNLDIKTAESNFRKFQLQLIGKKNGH